MNDTYRLEYKLKYLINKAIMTEKPLVVVEGYDDRDFYSKLGYNYNVKVSEVILKNNEQKYYDPGCEGVIKIVKDAQEYIQKNEKVEKLFLGIIDFDYRKYIDTGIDGLKGLFVLKFYSFESHFVSVYSRNRFITMITRASQDEITDKVVKILETGIKNRLEELYYAGLEVLKSRCVSDYVSLVDYDKGVEFLYQEDDSHKSIIQKVMQKKEELDNFADSKSITFSEHYMNIIRGKWLLYVYVSTIYDNIKNVALSCKEGQIEQCEFCKNGKSNLCIWKRKIELKKNSYVNYMVEINKDGEPQIDYIKQRLGALGIQ